MTHRQSCFYVGVVRHRRTWPTPHAFRQKLYMAYVDLAEVESLLGRFGWWSTRRFSPARFRRNDHFGDPAISLDDCVRNLVDERLGRRPRGPIRLLTHFRQFGFLMNPISLFYCFDPAGDRVEAIVAEVNNTPWNERHCYVLDVRGESRRLHATHAKEFHVSPFLTMQRDYHWRMSSPKERLAVCIEARRAGEPAWTAMLALERRPWTMAWRTLLPLRFPWMTMQAYAAIYWHAFRLWLKGVPFVPHPNSLPAGAEASVKRAIVP